VLGERPKKSVGGGADMIHTAHWLERVANSGFRLHTDDKLIAGCSEALLDRVVNWNVVQAPGRRPETHLFTKQPRNGFDHMIQKCIYTVYITHKRAKY
jgi:hypothetical protein